MDTTFQKLGCKKLFHGVQMWLVLSMLGFCLFTAAGCQFAPKQSFAWPWSKEKKDKQPERLLPVWSETVLYQTNQPGVRGFGGRLYFYEKGETEPIEVDGGLAVYVFDADSDELQQQKPLRKFVFTPEQFANHMSRTSIGPSYSVWLPWGEVGGPPLRLSLIARFEGTEAGTVISDPTIKLLPGVPAKNQPTEANSTSGSSNSRVQLASHAGSAASPPKASENQRSTEPDAAPDTAPRRAIGTIDLPPSFQRHLRLKEGGRPGSPSAATTSESLQESPVTPAVGPLNPPLNPDRATHAGESLNTAAHDTPAVGPTTTTVIDARSRDRRNPSENSNGQPANYGGSRSKRDIRQGKWIEPGR